MRTVKQQYGTTVFDGVEKKYCKVVIEMDSSDDSVTKDSLKEQFGLLADSFWLYLKEQDELSKHLDTFNNETGLGFESADIKKGWS